MKKRERSPKPQGFSVLLVQCIAVGVILAVVGILRLFGGGVYEEWKTGFHRAMANNAPVDDGVTALVGEMDGSSTEVTS